MLVGGGTECGPSNPLQTLSKRFDQDRGVQQVGQTCGLGTGESDGRVLTPFLRRTLRGHLVPGDRCRARYVL